MELTENILENHLRNASRDVKKEDFKFGMRSAESYFDYLEKKSP